MVRKLVIAVLPVFFAASCTHHQFSSKREPAQQAAASAEQALPTNPDKDHDNEPLPGMTGWTVEAFSTRGGVTWLLYGGKHWQRTMPGQKTVKPEQDEATTGTAKANHCKQPGMIEVEGLYRLDRDPKMLKSRSALSSVEDLQKTTCTDWIQKNYPERCKSFDKEKWQEIAATLGTKPMHFCMDRFEYPNEKGAFPVIMVNWDEAKTLCEAQGKRLCNEEEWTFACEGDQALPYPTGYERLPDGAEPALDPTGEAPRICNIDRRWSAYNAKKLIAYRASKTPSTIDKEATANELERLWQGKVSGAMTECVSPFGVHDMPGNIDEWTHSRFHSGNPSILKGGYWGPVRTRCRPSTRSHDHNHIFYQQGFRCCAGPSISR